MSVTSETSSSPTSPQMESCDWFNVLETTPRTASEENCTYSHFHALFGDLLQAAHHILLHLNELGELLGQIGPERTGGIAAKCMACYRRQLAALVSARHGRLTKRALAEETARFSGRGRRRRVLEDPSALIAVSQASCCPRRADLNLGRSGRPRLAHRVCAMHLAEMASNLKSRRSMWLRGHGPRPRIDVPVRKGRTGGRLTMFFSAAVCVRREVRKSICAGGASVGTWRCRSKAGCD